MPEQHLRALLIEVNLAQKQERLPMQAATTLTVITCFLKLQRPFSREISQSSFINPYAVKKKVD